MRTTFTIDGATHAFDLDRLTFAEGRRCGQVRVGLGQGVLGCGGGAEALQFAFEKFPALADTNIDALRR
jgi:hypothetical protein